MRMAEFAKQANFLPISQEAHREAQAQMDGIRNNNGTERPGQIRKELQVHMDEHVGVFRTGNSLESAIEEIRELKERYQNIKIDDKSMKWNTDLMEAWELGCLLDLAEVTAFSALARTESRGAHYREDYPERDDKNFLKHSLVWGNSHPRIAYKPVRLGRYQPTERKY
jgi:succinate dehydrogenase / fumarate reductase flavoprotein subunit